MAMEEREVVYSAESAIGRVYFPTRGLIAVLAELQNGRALEVATIGPEGMTGIALFLEIGSASSRQRVLSATAGEGFALTADAFAEEAGRSLPFRALLARYSLAYMARLAQTAACNGGHQLKRRLARILLACQDAALADNFGITQEFLASVLGVQRPGVSLVAEELRRTATISYRRGEVRVLDRRRLEARSCECYTTLREEYDRAFA
jgi:CRP-like cAMP-binding protein